MKHAVMLALVGLFCAGPGSAEVTPAAGAHDNRVRVARYVDGQVYRINVSMLKVTAVEFGPDEEIRSIVAGDTEGFNFDAIPGGRAMVIKPMLAGVTTNITVYTNKRSYYFTVTETSKATHYVVRFQHPNAGNAAVARNAVVKAPPYSSYGAEKLTSITPTEVWDDGTFTYFRFKRNGSLPAIFRVSDGRERTSNTTALADGSIRVSGVSQYWVLRAGDVENTIARLGAGQ